MQLISSYLVIKRGWTTCSSNDP